MATVEKAPVAQFTVTRGLTFADLKASLTSGLRDFLACQIYGLFFASIYVGGGLFAAYALFQWGSPTWLIPIAAGFPLIAPFIAVGLYEVSRRRELGLPMSWGAVLGALRGRGDEQILSMGIIVFVAFGFWLMVAHGIFAIFLAESGIGSESMEIFQTNAGILMLVVGSFVGALMALGFYSITVMSLPMLVDKEVDFLTAIITSLAAIRCNKPVLIGWAIIISVLLFIAMIPAFLGMLIALPVLGHATWHLYRRAVSEDVG